MKKEVCENCDYFVPHQYENAQTGFCNYKFKNGKMITKKDSPACQIFDEKK
jgi:hypothetical protein